MATAKPAPEATAHGRALNPRPLIVVGGGEHARVVIETIRDAGAVGSWTVIGFADQDPAPAADGRLGVDHLGTDADVAARSGAVPAAERPWLVLGFGGHGSVSARAQVVDLYGPDARWATVVHPTAWVSPKAILGPGTVVLAGAIVGVGARLGRHVIVNTRAVIEHDVEIGDQVQVAPGAVIGGAARIGAWATIGMGALVRDHVEIGPGAVVGMGSVVVADVPAEAVVMGSPARQRGTPESDSILADAGLPRA